MDYLISLMVIIGQLDPDHGRSGRGILVLPTIAANEKIFHKTSLI
jgi:hypothetical protein